jgi:hypothetical protein
VFNPIIQYIKQHNEKSGYEIKTQNNTTQFINTTPFADDFNLISRNKTQHQKLISDVENKIRSRGLVIKPSKCASLSIQSGKSTEVNFTLKENGNRYPIELIKNKPQKFLGSMVTAFNKPQDMFEFLSEKLNKKLQNIDNSSLRGEHKMKIYSRYALISMRYHLSVHDIHKTHLDKLDNVASIVNIFANAKITANPFHCIKNLSKLSLLSSYTIFHAYTQPTWRDPPFLTP